MPRKKEGWFKPYILNPHNIEKVVSQGPGVYVLGYIGPDKKFQVKHIHSTVNPKQELKSHLGKFPIFMYKPLKFHLNAFQDRQQPLRLTR
jgi:hypothetical protein